jgi:hypothetical protein
VCTFRVERHDDEGHELPVVPIEMRGLSFQGVINEGDWIEVKEHWRPGQTLKPRRVLNLTTRGWFLAKGSSGVRSALGFLLFVVIAGAMIAFFLFFASSIM